MPTTPENARRDKNTEVPELTLSIIFKDFPPTDFSTAA